MEKAISSSFSYLCKNTTVTEELLLELYGNDMLTDTQWDELKNGTSNLNQSTSLYKILKKQPDSDLPILIDILKRSGNKKAAEQLEQVVNDPDPPAGTQKKSITDGSIEISKNDSSEVNPDSTSGAEAKTTRLRNSPRTKDVTKLMFKDKDLVKNWDKLGDILDIDYSSFLTLETGIRTGTMSLDTAFNTALSIWISRKSKGATIGNLVAKLKEYNFQRAADFLADEYYSDVLIVV